jgi:hypothetical protein
MQHVVNTDATKAPAAQTGVWILIPIVATTIVYARVIGHYFAGDEFIHFFNLANYGLAELVLNPHGGHILLTSNAVYALLFPVFGLDATGYYAIALLTHLCVVGLLYGAILRWSGTLTAVVVSTMWGISPLAEGSIGWFGVYGHLLVGAAVAWILRDLARISTGEAHPSAWLLARWYMLILIAATSFGFGLSIAIVFPIAVYGLLSGAPKQRLVAGVFATLWIAIPVLYILVHLSYASISDRDALHGVSQVAAKSEFTDLSSLFLLFISKVPSVLTEFLSIGVASLPFGPLIALGPTYGASYGFVLMFSKIVLFVMAVLFVWRLRSRTRDERLYAASCFILALASYGTIAIWDVIRAISLPESMPPAMLALLLPAPLTFRYHYVAPMLLAVAAAIAIGPVSFPKLLTYRIASCALLAAMMVASYVAVQALKMPDLKRDYDRVVAAIDREIDLAPVAGPVYIQNKPFKFWGFDLPEQFPGWAAVFTISFPTNEVRGRRVWFIEHDEKLIRMFAGDSSRLSQLLVSPIGDIATEPVPDKSTTQAATDN